MVLFGKSARKKCIPPIGVAAKFGYPLSESLSKMGNPPPGCRKLFSATRVNRVKRASRAAGELHERGNLPCSVFLVGDINWKCMLPNMIGTVDRLNFLPKYTSYQKMRERNNFISGYTSIIQISIKFTRIAVNIA